MKKLLVFAVLLPILSLAQIPKPLSNTYVNDFAGVLSRDQIQNLNVQIQNIEHGYSVQIAVVLIDKLPEGIDIEDYARVVGREWHVGNAKNGLVYVASIQEHKQRMEVAQNLEGSISDIVSSELTNDIKPYFRKGDYSGGLQNMIYQIEQKLRPVQAEQQSLGAAELVKKKEQGWAWWQILFFIICPVGLLVWFLIHLITKKNKKESDTIGTNSTYGNSYPSPHATPVYPPHYYGGGGGHNTNIITPIITTNNYESDRKRDDGGYSSGIDYGSSYSSGSSYDSSSSSSSSGSDFGSWGSGSSDSSSSSDSGFSGGGSTDSW